MTAEFARAFRLKATLAFAAVYLVWGSTYLAIRFAIETLPAFTMAGVRFLVAGSLMLLWAVLRGSWRRPTIQEWRSTALLGFLLLFCANGGVVWAEYQVPSGLAALLVAAEPLFVVLLLCAWPGERRPGWRTFAALAVGFAGTALLTASGGELGGGLHLPSVLVILFACGAWAFGSLYSRDAALPASPVVSAGLQMLHGGVFLLVFGLALGEGRNLDPSAWSGRSLAGLAYLIVFGSIVAFSSYAWLVRNVRATVVSTYAYVNPVVAIFLGWLLAGEPLNPTTFLAAALILGAVFVISTDRSTAAGSAAVTERQEMLMEAAEAAAEGDEEPCCPESPAEPRRRCA